MTNYQFPFVKGHMGGNEIILIGRDERGEFPTLQQGLSFLNPPYIRGDQLGFIGSSEVADIKVSILDRSYEDYLPMCGGLTQVLGHAVAETGLRSLLKNPLEEGSGSFALETDSGIIPIRIEKTSGELSTVYTDMTSFVQHSYQLGVEDLDFERVSATRAGDFLVLEADQLERGYPGVNLDGVDETAKKALQSVQKQFEKLDSTPDESADYAVYDLHSKECDGRLIFPHRVSSAHIEPACGTGTVAVGLALAFDDRVTSDLTLEFEAGGTDEGIGGPERTELQLVLKDG
ncbi:MAG: hypothetical protein ACOCZX_01180, partial [Candidatus Bipolaricaulota bacterium]